jgi:ABC-type nickel/cobalt efflux system permease component RcnA
MSSPGSLMMALLGVDLPKSNRSLGKVPGLLLSDVLLILGLSLGLLLVLAFAIFLWKKLRKKRRRHISGGEKVYRDSAGQEDEEAEGEASDPDDDHDHHTHSHGDEDDDEPGEPHHHHQSGRRYKYRKRRRTHRSRNPTLSETGGLPPVKSQEPGKPF